MNPKITLGANGNHPNYSLHCSGITEPVSNSKNKMANLNLLQLGAFKISEARITISAKIELKRFKTVKPQALL